MYGNGGVPPPPIPPVPQDRESHATNLPSLSAAILTRANPDGRMPATSCSAVRSSIILTGLPAADLDNCAEVIPQRSGENLLPKPPPMYCCITWILPAETPRGSAICEAMPERF